MDIEFLIKLEILKTKREMYIMCNEVRMTDGLALAYDESCFESLVEEFEDLLAEYNHSAKR